MYVKFTRLPAIRLKGDNNAVRVELRQRNERRCPTSVRAVSRFAHLTYVNILQTDDFILASYST